MPFPFLFETSNCKCSCPCMTCVSEHIASMSCFIIIQILMIKISTQGDFRCPSIFEPILFFLAETASANPRELIVDVMLSPIQKPALPIEEVIQGCEI